MPRLSLKRIPPVPISKLINENMDSITLSGDIIRLIREFDRYEVEEDKLKDFIRNSLYAVKDPEMKWILGYIYDTIQKIDRIQDRIIETILSISKRIKAENRRSNGILKEYDIYIDSMREKILRQLDLWRWEKNDKVNEVKKEIRFESFKSYRPTKENREMVLCVAEGEDRYSRGISQKGKAPRGSGRKGVGK